MASIVKVPVAMLVASESANGSLSLDEKITIHSQAATPGPIGNPLDRFYFLPLNIVRTHTMEQLMAFMLQNSDNTAADALLHRLGGTSAVTKFLADELEIKEICFRRTMHELLTYYYALHRYQVPTSSRQEMCQRIGKIVENVRRMTPPYVCRLNREERLIDSREETCTPRAMADLLTRLTMNPKYALVYSHMQRCATNKRRIAEGLREYRPVINSFGHKTGSVGAIANDAAIVQFNNGDFAVLVVMTCLSTVRMSIRDEQIATVARAIMRKWRTAIGESA